MAVRIDSTRLLSALCLCSHSHQYPMFRVVLYHLLSRSHTQFGATELIILAGIVGLVWAFAQFRIIAAIPIQSASSDEEGQGLLNGNHEVKTKRLKEIYQAIYEGAESFLKAEYTVVVGLLACLPFRF